MALLNAAIFRQKHFVYYLYPPSQSPSVDMNPMIHARMEHACSWVWDERWKVTLVVVGGYNDFNGKDSLNLQAPGIPRHGLNLVTSVHGIRRDNENGRRWLEPLEAL